MRNYKRQRVLSVRVAEDDLESLANQAKADGRSISGQVAFLVRERVTAWREPQRRARKISGWLSHLHVPESHAVFRAARRKAGAKLLKAVSAKAERRGTS